jgi:hypothetical protein
MGANCKVGGPPIYNTATSRNWRRKMATACRMQICGHFNGFLNVYGHFVLSNSLFEVVNCSSKLKIYLHLFQKFNLLRLFINFAPKFSAPFN